jgi:hypothetical protein
MPEGSPSSSKPSAKFNLADCAPGFCIVEPNNGISE